MTKDETKKFTIDKTPEFDSWLTGMRNTEGKAAVLARLDRAQEGNFGDCESVGDGISEMRVFVGPGYRIYFVRTAKTTFLMLWGSDKSDQKRGVNHAKAILEALKGN